MSDDRGSGDGGVEVVLVPDDDESRAGFAAAVEALGGSASTLARAEGADRLQDALRERWPAADVLHESASAPGAAGRARLTIYRDGADAA